MARLDATHDPALRSWVASANGHPDFPIQNLPFGVFRRAGGATPRGGVAIGDQVLDLRGALGAGAVHGEARRAARGRGGPTLNALAGARRRAAARAARCGCRELLATARRPGSGRAAACMPRRACTLHLPARDRRLHRLLRRHPPRDQRRQAVPARQPAAAELQVGADRLPRPRLVDRRRRARRSGARTGRRKPPGDDGAELRPEPPARLRARARHLDRAGQRARRADRRSARRPSHIVGFCLLNDWSARDIQAWEYQPLGPFLAKNFATTISPWIVTLEALAPFRIAQPPRPEGDPAPLPYLIDAARPARPARSTSSSRCCSQTAAHAARRACRRIGSRCRNARHMYWTVAQLVAHHTSNGCNLQPGDLLGTGTHLGARRRTGSARCSSSPTGGKQPIALPTGETRTLPRGRRRGDPARPRQPRGLRVDRLRRVPRHGARGGLIDRARSIMVLTVLTDTDHQMEWLQQWRRAATALEAVRADASGSPSPGRRIGGERDAASLVRNHAPAAPSGRLVGTG